MITSIPCIFNSSIKRNPSNWITACRLWWIVNFWIFGMSKTFRQGLPENSARSNSYWLPEAKTSPSIIYPFTVQHHLLLTEVTVDLIIHVRYVTDHPCSVSRPSSILSQGRKWLIFRLILVKLKMPEMEPCPSGAAFSYLNRQSRHMGWRCGS